MGKSPNVSEGTGEEAGENERNTEEKDGENQSLSRVTQQGRWGQRDTSWYPFAISALSFPVILWHGRVWLTVKEHTSGVLP